MATKECRLSRSASKPDSRALKELKEEYNTLKEERKTMQSFLNDLRARNWEDAKQHSYSVNLPDVNLPSVNDEQPPPLSEFISTIKSWYERTQTLAQVRPEIASLKKERETMQSLLNDLRTRNWKSAGERSYHVDLPDVNLPTVNDEQPLPLFKFIPTIKRWYEGTQALAQVEVAYKEAQANLAQLKELEQEHKTMQSLLNDLRARNWEGAQKHFYRMDLPTVNDK